MLPSTDGPYSSPPVRARQPQHGEGSEPGRRYGATLAVGCRFSEVGTGSYGLEPANPLVHVDVDPEVPGRMTG